MREADTLPHMKTLGEAIAAILGGFVLSILTAILTARFWGWFEDRTGIESLGHSGPADWVYIFLWILWSAILLTIVWRSRASRQN